MSDKQKLATEIYMALNGNGYFSDIWPDEYEERKQKIIATIEAELPEEDIYLVGLHEDEIREVLKHDFDELEDEELLDELIERFGEFDYSRLWDDVSNFTQSFLDDEKDQQMIDDIQNPEDLRSLNPEKASENEQRRKRRKLER